MEMLKDHILAAAELRTALRDRARVGGRPSQPDRSSLISSGHARGPLVGIREALIGQLSTGDAGRGDRHEMSSVRHATGPLGSWI